MRYPGSSTPASATGYGVGRKVLLEYSFKTPSLNSSIREGEGCVYSEPMRHSSGVQVAALGRSIGGTTAIEAQPVLREKIDACFAN
jgi:hypothetical protein